MAATTQRQLDLTLISAKDLKDVNFLSKMDVYAFVALSSDPGTRQRTPTAQDCGRNPNWNCPMRFPIPHAVQRSDLTLHVQIRSERALGDRDIGEVYIPIKELESDKGASSGQNKFAAYQVRAASGKAKGILNISYKFDGSIASCAPPSVGYPPVDSKLGGTGMGMPQTSKPGEAVNAYPMSKPGEAVNAYPMSKPGEAVNAYPMSKPVEPVTAYPMSSGAAAYPLPAGSSSAYPPPSAPYGYGMPQQPYAGYPGPPPPAYGYAGPPPPGAYGSSGYAPPPPPPVQKPPKKNKFGMGLGAGLLGGALGGLLIGDAIGDMSSSGYEDGYDAGFDDGGGFDF